MSTPEHECPWGRRAVELLITQQIAFQDVQFSTQDAIIAFKTQHNVATMPQIFVGEQRIGGYTELAAYLNVEAQTANAQPSQSSYTPVIALFSTAGLVSLSASLGLTGFMGVSLAMLASLKLMDLPSFANSFAQYDLMTQRVQPYACVYPFLELGIALGFLSGVMPLATGVGSALVGVSGAVSVVKAAYLDKRSLNCACVGGDSKAPLGMVSFVENAMMTVMGVMLLVSALTVQRPETHGLQPQVQSAIAHPIPVMQ